MNLPYYNAYDQTVLPSVPGIILSNTCDMDPKPNRVEDIHLCFAPIFRLAKYEKRLESSGYDTKKIQEHILNVKKQILTHLFYLPVGGDLSYEVIIPFDRICYVPNAIINRQKLQKNRLFTLSDFGNYLFLLKMSIHFTRIRENIDRNKGLILSV